MLLKIILSLSPVFVFLAVLVIMDSFKLVKLKEILLTIVAGMLVAFAALLVNTFLLNYLFADVRFFSRYLAPLIEGEDYPTYRGGLPRYVRLKNVLVAKKLPGFKVG